MIALQNTDIEKRACERHSNNIPVRLTRFNTGYWQEAKTLNHCLEGMCVKSNAHFQPGTTLLIRVEHGASGASSSCDFQELPTIILAEVKWCREISEISFFAYEAGVKYYAPHY
jgi:hypothetical protein